MVGLFQVINQRVLGHQVSFGLLRVFFGKAQLFGFLELGQHEFLEVLHGIVQGVSCAVLAVDGRQERTVLGVQAAGNTGEVTCPEDLHTLAVEQYFHFGEGVNNGVHEDEVLVANFDTVGGFERQVRELDGEAVAVVAVLARLLYRFFQGHEGVLAFEFAVAGEPLGQVIYDVRRTLWHVVPGRPDLTAGRVLHVLVVGLVIVLTDDHELVTVAVGVDQPGPVVGRRVVRLRVGDGEPGVRDRREATEHQHQGDQVGQTHGHLRTWGL